MDNASAYISINDTSIDYKHACLVTKYKKSYCHAYVAGVP